MKPSSVGHLGETYFDGETTWLCMGGAEWVDHIEAEEPPKAPFPVPAWLEREREQFHAVINDWAAAYAKLAREHEKLKADANRRLCDD